jgi:signal transduction histidine kinase
MSEPLALRAADLGRLRHLVRSHTPRYVATVGLVVAAYYGAAKLGYAIGFAGPVAAIVWLPVGVGIASLYIGGLGLWPGVLAGDLLANDYTALPLGAALGQTAGNLLEVVVAALLLRRLVRGSALDSVQGVGSMLLAFSVGTLISATIGSLSLLHWGVITYDAVPRVWRTWWLGDASGALIVVPLVLAWLRRVPLPARTSSKTVEALVLLVALAGLSEIAFRSATPLTYLVFPALTWAALRFGQRGSTLAVVVAASFAVWNTVHYAGPFHFHSITHSILSVQLYIAVAAVSTLCLAAVVAERRTYAAGLARSRTRIVEAADEERRRLERNLHDGAQHRLTALAYFLRTAAGRARSAPDESPELFEQAEGEVSLAIDELRELAHGIHPAVLTDLGLSNALKSIAARSLGNVVLVELPTRRVDATTEATAYYVVAEAVTNAQRYAHASTIRIRATVAPKALRVSVDDDGVGGAHMSIGSGLQGLCDRVEAVGGTFRLLTTPGRGTRVEALIPARPL